MRRRILALLAIVALLAGCVGAQADETASLEALSAFRTFCTDAAGRYTILQDGDTVVLELLPAFGRLFASVAYYAEGDCLYSYYAAELTPGDLTKPENRADCAPDSFALTVRSWSNMSMAGQFWPGGMRQRFTLTGNGLALSGAEGDGDALISRDDALLSRDDGAPSVLIYSAESAEMICRPGERAAVPEALAGDWSVAWREGGVDWLADVSFEPDGIMTLLLDGEDGQPPRLLRGGYALIPAEEGAYELCCLLAGPGTGTMPFEGRAWLAADADEMIVSAIAGEDCPLLPEGEERVAYGRGAQPLKLAWMTLADQRDGEKFMDVRAVDPFDGSEEYLTVMKDGGTLFGWSSDMQEKDRLLTGRLIQAGVPMPVLYRARWGTVDTLLLLGDIAEDTRLLMMRAPYFAALGDYREQVADGSRRGSEASVYFDEAGEPMLRLANTTDYEVQREMTARITRRVGSVYTAEDEAGNAVTFAVRPYGWLSIIEQRLTFATHGFPGFGEEFCRCGE